MCWARSSLCIYAAVWSISLSVMRHEQGELWDIRAREMVRARLVAGACQFRRAVLLLWRYVCFAGFHQSCSVYRAMRLKAESTTFGQEFRF